MNSKVILVIPLMVFLLVPTAVFAQTDFGSTSNQTISGFEPLEDIVMTPPPSTTPLNEYTFTPSQEIEITTPITGLVSSPPDGFESVTVEKFGTNYETFVDESGYLYRVYDMWSNVTITGLVNSEQRTFQQYNDSWHYELDADNKIIIINDMVEQSEYPQVTENYTIEQIDDETFLYSTHTPYVSDGYDWKPYVLGQDENVVQVQVAGGTIVFDKVAGAVTIFNDYETVIDSDSYTVRTALLDSDVWASLDVNNADVETTVVEDGDKVTVSFIRENNEGLFKTEYVIGSGQVKTTAYFTNYIYDNNKFAFTQTLDLPDSIISLNEMESIDLTDYVGQSFPREVLEQNEDLILNIKDMYYSSGLGFDNLWSVNVTTPTKVSLDYANVEQTQTVIGDTVELDPIFGIGTTAGWIRSVGVTSTPSQNCPVASDSKIYYLRNYNSYPSYNGCRAPIAEFDVSSIPDNATVTSVNINYEIDWVSGASNGMNAVDWNDISIKDHTTTMIGWDDATNASSGQSYVTNETGGNGSAGDIVNVNLGTLGNTNVENQLNASTSVDGVADWFSVGFPFSNTTQQSYVRDVGYKNVAMSVVYTLPPSTPTNVTTTANGSNVDLSWTASNSNSDYIVSSSASTADGTNYGATNGVSGKIGNAWDFDGINDYVNIPSITNGSNGYTWSVWADITSNGNGMEILGKANAGNLLIPDESTYGSSWASVYFAGTTSGTGINTMDSGWHHYVGVTDCAGYSQWQCPVTIYMDGSSIATGTSGYYADNYYFLGARNNSGSPAYFTNGTIDELAIYQRALTSSEVGTLYNSGNANTPNSISTSNLSHYYNFEQTGNTLTNMAVTVDPLVVTYDVKRDGTSLGTTTNTSFTDTTTAYGTPYLFSLTASTSNGTSPSTANIPITLTVPAPTNLSATLNIPNVDLSWTGGTGATGYKIEHSTDGTTWTNVVANASANPWTWDSANSFSISVNGTEITKTSGAGWNSYIRTNQTITSGSGGSIAWKLPTATSNNYETGGFSQGSYTPNSTYSDFKYSIMFINSGQVQVWENNAHMGNFTITGFNPSTSVFKVDMDNTGTVTYWHNNELLHTSNTTASGTYYGHAALYTQNTTLLMLDESYSHTAPTQNSDNYYQVKALIGSAESTANTGSSTITPVNYRTYTSTASASTCDTGTITADIMHEIGMPSQVGGNRYCLVTSMEYDISAISDAATITSAVIEESHVIWSTGFSPSCDYKSNMFYQPSTSTTQEKWDSVIAGTVYANDPACITGYTSNNVYDVPLSAQAMTDIETQLSGDWFGINWAIDNFPSLANAGTVGTPSSIYNGSSLLKLEYIAPASLAVGGTPDAPTGLTATFNTTTADMDLAFTAPSQTNGSAIVGYKVEVSTDDITYTTLVADTGNTNTTYTDLNPTMGSLNYYKVSAINAYGSGAVSNTDNDMAGVPPDAPTITSTSTDSANSAPLEITVNWSAPTVTGTAGISNYEVYRDSTLITTVGNVTTYVDTVPTGGGTFVYELKSVTPHGTSVLSATASHTTPTPPPAPTSSPTLDIANPNPSPFDVTVTFAMPSSGGSAITSFEIFRSTDDVTFASVGTTSTLIFSDTVPNAGTFYYKFASTNLVGNSGQSPSGSITTATVPDSPTVTLAINNPNTLPFDITATFVAPASDGGSALIDYDLQYSDDNVTFAEIAGGITGSYTHTVATAGTHYFQATVRNNVGDSVTGVVANMDTPTVPDAPTVAVTTDNPNTNPLDITSSFVAPADNGGSTITGYNLFVSDDDITYTQVQTNVTADQVTTVASSGTYYFKAQAINLVGTSLQGSASINVTPTLPSVPLNATSAISNVDTAPYTMIVSWDTPTSNGGSNLTGYDVYRKQGSASPVFITNTTALTITDTVPSVLSTNFTYQIYSVNNVGQSATYVDTVVTTNNVPSAPVLAVTTGTTVLSWNAPASDATITGYKVFRDSVLLTTVTTLTHTDFTTIVFGNSYVYKVVAVSSLGDSADSNNVTTTPETEITGMVALGVTGTGAVIDWDEPAYYQGQVTSYNVYYGNSGTPATGAGTTTNTYSNFAPQLDYDTTYVFGVSINSPLGNSGLSNIVAITTNVDTSIVSSDPTTGGMSWFDIDSVNNQSVNVIEFQRETQDDIVNGTTVVFDTLQVGYPSWWDEMTCDVDYKFAGQTDQYVEGTDMVAVVNPADGNQQIIGFQFHDIDNEVVTVQCAPQQTTQDDGVSAKYVMTQNSFGTLQADGTYTEGLPNIPIVSQITNFSNGTYGTDGDFGALNIVGLFAILISMVGFNRLNPIVGVLLSASMIFVLSWFGIITIPTALIGAIALVIFLAWGATRNR